MTGGTVAFAPHAAAAPVVLTEIASLSLTGNATLDLSNNDLIVHNGSLGAMTALVKSGYGPAGNWQGTGIISSTAAGDPSHLTTLGILLNTNGGGIPIHSSFEGQPSGATDVLLKYTYYRRCRFIRFHRGWQRLQPDRQRSLGLTAKLTGWQNGDFNYDGVVEAAVAITA